MIDIRDYPEVVDEINAILNSHGTCEIKNEANRTSAERLVVVEISRKLKLKTENA